jgi:hypothetical protein
MKIIRLILEKIGGWSANKRFILFCLVWLFSIVLASFSNRGEIPDIYFNFFLVSLVFAGIVFYSIFISNEAEGPKRIIYFTIRILSISGVFVFLFGFLYSSGLPPKTHGFFDGFFVLFRIAVRKIANGEDRNILFGFIFSLSTFIFGEILMFSFKAIQLKNLMICPTCIGKGFVDQNDIQRMGMQDQWEQGYCRYCDGEGKVTKGITKRINPLDPINGPQIDNYVDDNP